MTMNRKSFQNTDLFVERLSRPKVDVWSITDLRYTYTALRSVNLTNDLCYWISILYSPFRLSDLTLTSIWKKTYDGILSSLLKNLVRCKTKLKS